jgi:hypothetical protein
MRFPSVLAFLAAASTFAPRLAHADPPSPELMARLAASSAAMDVVRKRACYTIDGHIDTLDGDGKVSGVETSRARVEKDGSRTHLVIENATKDGKDVTDEERKKADREEGKHDEEKQKGRLDIPFLAADQPKYAFDQVETDPKDPTHVRITFTPKAPDEHSVEGSAWVDTSAGQFLSAGFKVSKPGFFVDYIHVTVEVGARTELGPAVSRITFDGKGGFLFIHKHFRGSEVLGNYRIGPKS